MRYLWTGLSLIAAFTVFAASMSVWSADHRTCAGNVAAQVPGVRVVVVSCSYPLWPWDGKKR